MQILTKEDRIWMAGGAGLVILAGTLGIIMSLTMPDEMCLLLHLDRVAEEIRALE